MTLSEIQEIVSHNFKYEKEVTLDTKLTDITGDSLEFLALMFHIEEKYDIDLELEFFEDVETVKNLIDKMEKKSL
jgi:acyl carrier protein